VLSRLGSEIFPVLNKVFLTGNETFPVKNEAFPRRKAEFSAAREQGIEGVGG